jgi:carbon storage regulator
MLVFSRKTGQRTVIAGSIRVVVLAVRGDRVKLGFEGPAHVPIHREEVLERIVQEGMVAESAGHREDGSQHVGKTVPSSAECSPSSSSRAVRSLKQSDHKPIACHLSDRPSPACIGVSAQEETEP